MNTVLYFRFHAPGFILEQLYSNKSFIFCTTTWCCTFLLYNVSLFVYVQHDKFLIKLKNYGWWTKKSTACILELKSILDFAPIAYEKLLWQDMDHTDIAKWNKLSPPPCLLVQNQVSHNLTHIDWNFWERSRKGSVSFSTPYFPWIL